jgi:hypothetical protein
MKSIKSFKELSNAWLKGKPLFWNDPEPIKGNDYRISFIEDITDDFERDTPILIQYSDGGSEAEVFLHEILIAK